MKFLLRIALAAPFLNAQSLSVYSELAHINQLGEVTVPETPREILSPALARNAYTSFQLVVHALPGAEWRLYVGQNPENAVRVSMYRELGGDLEHVDLPYDSDGTKVFWMDLWTAGDAPVRRVKVEPEIFVNNDWVIYPIEARVMDARVPEEAHVEPREFGTSSPREAMRGYLCDAQQQSRAHASEVSIAALSFRNALQDVALARQASKDELKKLFGACDAPTPENPESYLRIRDYLFRLR